MRRRVAKKTKDIILFSLGSKFTFFLSAEIVFSIFLALFALLLFFKLGDDVFQKEVFAFDNSITQSIYQYRSLFFNTIMLNITFLGSGLFLFCGSVLMILYLSVKRKKDALLFSTILYTGVIINLLLKEIFHRDRPHLLPLVNENSYSFPSGHAMNSFVFYTAFSYFIFRVTQNVKLSVMTSFIAILLIGIIGISRIYLGAHYPSDVLAGFIGGFFWFTTGILFEKTLLFERMYRLAKRKKYHAKKQ